MVGMKDKPPAPARYTVKRAAQIGKVTVRTLHHYHERGLLVPAARSESGYRLYSDDDLSRLHRIRLYQALGFSLEETARLLDDDGVDEADALKAQRRVLAQQIEKKEATLRALDRALRVLEGEQEMAASMFDDFDPEAHAAEAEQRWGETDAYKESMRRTKRYTDADWAEIKAEADGIMREFVELMEQDADSDGEAAVDVAERYRLHLSQRFYEMSKAMHATVAQGYVDDARFTANFDKHKEGLAAFVTAAVQANAAR